MPESLRWLLHARIMAFLREPEAVFWTFGFPILIALALGIAFRNKPPDRIDVAVEQGAHGEDAALFRALGADTSLAAVVLPAEESAKSLRTGKVAIIVAPGASDGEVTLRYDLTRPEALTARLAVVRALDAGSGIAHAYREEDQLVSEPGSRYIDFLVPGLIGMNIMNASFWGIGWSIVDARSRKLLKRYAATPMPRSHYLLAFMLGHLVLVSALLILTLGFARVAFDVRVFGSYLSVFAVAMMGAASFAAFALLMCSRTENSETFSGMSNAVILPMFVGSGVFFSSAHFPAVVQPFLRALPLTALNDALRAVMTDGRPISSLGVEMVVLTVWGVVCFALALRIFRWV